MSTHLCIAVGFRKHPNDQQTDSLDIKTPIDPKAMRELLTALTKQGYGYIQTAKGYISFESYLADPSANSL